MGKRDSDGHDEPRSLRLALLVGLTGAAYVGVELALGYWRSWLLAGSIVAFAIALYFLIWPSATED